MEFCRAQARNRRASISRRCGGMRYCREMLCSLTLSLSVVDICRHGHLELQSTRTAIAGNGVKETQGERPLRIESESTRNTHKTCFSFASVFLSAGPCAEADVFEEKSFISNLHSSIRIACSKTSHGPDAVARHLYRWNSRVLSLDLGLGLCFAPKNKETALCARTAPPSSLHFALKSFSVPLPS